MNARQCGQCAAPATRVLQVIIPPLAGGIPYRWAWPIYACAAHAVTDVDPDQFFVDAWRVAMSAMLTAADLPVGDYGNATFAWLTAKDLLRDYGQTQGLAIEATRQ